MLTIFSIFKEDIALNKSIMFLKLDYSTVQTNSFFFTQKYLGRAHYALLHETLLAIVLNKYNFIFPLCLYLVERFYSKSYSS